jgi:hypothetical protein
MQVNWTQNVERCCSLGMNPISFTNADEQTCFGNLSSNGINFVHFWKTFMGKNMQDRGEAIWTIGPEGCKDARGCLAGVQDQISRYFLATWAGHLDNPSWTRATRTACTYVCTLIQVQVSTSLTGSARTDSSLVVRFLSLIEFGIFEIKMWTEQTDGISCNWARCLSKGMQEECTDLEHWYFWIWLFEF